MIGEIARVPMSDVRAFSRRQPNRACRQAFKRAGDLAGAQGVRRFVQVERGGVSVPEMRAGPIVLAGVIARFVVVAKENRRGNGVVIPRVRVAVRRENLVAASQLSERNPRAGLSRNFNESGAPPLGASAFLRI